MKTYLFAFLLILLTGCSDTLNKENTELREQKNKLSADKAKAEAELIKKEGEISASKERLADAKTRIDELKQEVVTLRDTSSKQSAQILELTERLKENERQLKEQKDSLAVKSADYEAQLQKLKTTQKGELNGVVTYFFNSNFGYKPDVGAEIYVFPVDAYSDFDPSVITEYQTMKHAMSWSKSTDQRLRQDSQKILSKYSSPVESAWKDLDARVVKMALPAEVGDKTIRLTADGNGAFKRSLQPGTYYTIIRSKHRQDMSVSEISGKIFVRKVEIKSGEEASLDAKFEVY
ncbi:MAG: hypothetical protein HY301_00415 [Verrucomicrobia bacterium]|nr:hypothetical protein [Verrucomicrobiota bacterium]